MDVLVDKIKGMVIIDPDNDQKREMRQIDATCAFFRKPVYDRVDVDVKIEEKMRTERLKSELGRYCSVLDSRECFIVFRKVEW